MLTYFYFAHKPKLLLFFFNQLRVYNVWMCHALFLLQWIQCVHMSQLPLNQKNLNSQVL
jgi:hypothetical protein